MFACSALLIVFGVNMDIHDTYQASISILEAANSQCPVMQIGTVELYVDINATDTMNLELSLAQAAEENAGWKPYPKDPLPLIGDDLPETSKFLCGTITSWCFGTFIMSLLTSPASGFISVIKTKGKRNYFLSLIATRLERANEISIMDIPNNELLFMLIYDPLSILKVHQTRREEKAVYSTEKIRFFEHCVKSMQAYCCCQQMAITDPIKKNKSAFPNKTRSRVINMSSLNHDKAIRL